MLWTAVAAVAVKVVGRAVPQAVMVVVAAAQLLQGEACPRMWRLSQQLWMRCSSSVAAPHPS